MKQDIQATPRPEPRLEGNLRFARLVDEETSAVFDLPRSDDASLAASVVCGETGTTLAPTALDDGAPPQGDRASGTGERPGARLAGGRALAEVERLMRALALRAGGDVAGELAAEQLATGGKRLRARLGLAAAEALGASPDDAVAWAAAVELLHNATLVHDDIQDGDRVRRGQPTLWARHGVPQAINAGDLLLMLPLVALGPVEATARGELSFALAEHALRTVRGQAAELELLAARRLDWASYLEATEGKTGALLGLPVYGAARLAGVGHATAVRLAAPFVKLGVLFQLQDDVLDLYADKGRGLPGSDLYEGKVSALVVEHLARRPEDRAALVRLLETPRAQTSGADVARAIAAFEASGALEAVLARIEAIAGEIASAAELAREPALGAVARMLCELALAPIDHLSSAEHTTRVA